MADVESIMVGWLADSESVGGAGWRVSADVPETLPPRLVTVERVGGTSDRFLDRPLVAVQVWGPTRFASASMAESVKISLLDMVELDAVGAVNVESIYYFPDSDSGATRYQMTVTCVIHN